jgi:hypothetical protein
MTVSFYEAVHTQSAQQVVVQTWWCVAWFGLLQQSMWLCTVVRTWEVVMDNTDLLFSKSFIRVLCFLSPFLDLLLSKTSGDDWLILLHDPSKIDHK